MSDWWTRALGGAAAPAPARDQAPLDAWWAPTPPAAEPPRPQSPAPPQPPAPPQAQSSRAADRCPMCHSGDYFRPHPEAKPRCYTCGYPVLHSTSGMVATDRTPAKAARQVNKEGGYHPEQVVGRVN